MLCGRASLITIKMECYCLFALVMISVGLCGGAEIRAKCVVERTTGKVGSPPVEGVIELIQMDSVTAVEVNLTGFNATQNVTKHGFHIHNEGLLTNGCLDAGGHYNPFDKDHGAPNDTERHVGDLGNLEVSPQGRVNITLYDRMIKLSGNTSVIGRSFVIHEDEDDLGKGTFPDSKTTGHAGARFACCKIVDSSKTSAASHITAYVKAFVAVSVLGFMI